MDCVLQDFELDAEPPYIVFEPMTFLELQEVREDILLYQVRSSALFALSCWYAIYGDGHNGEIHNEQSHIIRK